MSDFVEGAEFAVGSVIGGCAAGMLAAAQIARANRDANRLTGWAQYYAARSANAESEVVRLRQQLAAKNQEIAEVQEIAFDYKAAYEQLRGRLGKPRVAA